MANSTIRLGISGPTGPTGPAGATGPAGPAGPAGAKGANGTSGTSASLTAGSVTTSILKTSESQVHLTDASPKAVLTGGQYSFFPQTYGTRNMIALNGGTSSTDIYRTYVAIDWNTDGIDGLQADCYVKNRYVTSSGEIYWLWYLRNKNTKEIYGISAAPDHPCFGNGGKPNLTSHPFSEYDENTMEIVLINPDKDLLAEMEAKRYVDDDDIPDKSLLQVITDEYEIDEDSTAEWPSEPVTVGIPKDLGIVGDLVTPIQKVIPPLDYVLVKKLKLKG